MTLSAPAPVERVCVVCAEAPPKAGGLCGGCYESRRRITSSVRLLREAIEGAARSLNALRSRVDRLSARVTEREHSGERVDAQIARLAQIVVALQTERAALIARVAALESALDRRAA